MSTHSTGVYYKEGGREGGREGERDRERESRSTLVNLLTLPHTYLEAEHQKQQHIC